MVTEKNILDALVNDGEKIESLKINQRKDIDDEAVFVNCTLDYEDGSAMDVCLIIYNDGTWFSPYDWHGYIPEANEIESIDWMLGVTGRKAIILNGLPRMLV